MTKGTKKEVAREDPWQKCFSADEVCEKAGYSMTSTALKVTSNFVTNTLQSGMTYDENGKLKGFNAKVGFTVGAFAATSTAITESLMSDEKKAMDDKEQNGEEISWGEQERFDVKNKLISNTLFNGMVAAYQMSTGTKMTSQLRTNNALTLEDYAGRAAGMATKNLAPQREVKPQDEKEAERRKDSPLGKMLDMMEGALNAVGYGLKKAADTAMEVAGAIKNGAIAFGQKVINGVTAAAGMVANSDLGQRVGNLVGGIASGDGLYWENDREQAGRYYQENYGSLETVSYQGTEYGDMGMRHPAQMMLSEVGPVSGGKYRYNEEINAEYHKGQVDAVREAYGENCAIAADMADNDNLSQGKNGKLQRDVTEFLEEAHEKLKSDPDALQFDSKSQKSLDDLTEAAKEGKIQPGSVEDKILADLKVKKAQFDAVKELIRTGDPTKLGKDAANNLCNVIAHYTFGKENGKISGSFMDFYSAELSKGLIGSFTYDAKWNITGANDVFYGNGSGKWKEDILGKGNVHDERGKDNSITYTITKDGKTETVKGGYMVVVNADGEEVIKNKYEPEKGDKSYETYNAYKTVDEIFDNKGKSAVDNLNASGKDFAIIFMNTDPSRMDKQYQGNHWFTVAKDNKGTWRMYDHNNKTVDQGTKVNWRRVYAVTY